MKKGQYFVRVQYRTIMYEKDVVISAITDEEAKRDTREVLQRIKEAHKDNPSFELEEAEVFKVLKTSSTWWDECLKVFLHRTEAVVKELWWRFVSRVTSSVKTIKTIELLEHGQLND